MKVAVIGTGTIGGSMVLRLLSEGHEVNAFDLNSKATQELATAGAEIAASAAEATHRSEYVVTSLPRSEDVRQAFNDRSGILAGLQAGTVVVETSTVPPAVITELAQDVLKRSAMLVDAPLTSSIREHLKRPLRPIKGEANMARENAIAGNLCFFVGGDAAAVERAAPLLSVLGVEYHHLGPLGAGKVGKLVHNGINIAEVAIISEMLVMAEAADIALDKLVAVLLGTTNDSMMLRNHIARYTVPGHFPLGLFPVKYGAKDMKYILEAASDYGVECSVAAAVCELYERASNSPYSDYYHPVIFRYIRELSTPKSGSVPLGRSEPLN